jgi:uncharacterized protein with ACT and thioredoxin-like domain
MSVVVVRGRRRFGSHFVGRGQSAVVVVALGEVRVGSRVVKSWVGIGISSLLMAGSFVEAADTVVVAGTIVAAGTAAVAGIVEASFSQVYS